MSITDDKGFYLVTENDSLTAKCNIYKDGNELYEVESFYPGYYWAYEVHYEGDNVDVKMDGTPSGEETVIRVNLSDYSYSVVQE